MTHNLTPAELAIVVRIAETGDSNKVVAAHLGMVEGSLKMWLKAAMQKTGSHTRTKLALWALRNGLAPLHPVVSGEGAE